MTYPQIQQTLSVELKALGVKQIQPTVSVELQIADNQIDTIRPTLSGELQNNNNQILGTLSQELQTYYIDPIKLISVLVVMR